jgi:histidine triad (HIT) family protein
MATVQKVARAAKAAFKADGLQIRQYNEPAAGQTVFHLHFHILPLNEGQIIRPHSGKMADQALLAKQAEMIRKAL